MLVCLAGLVAYGCTSQKLPADPETNDDTSSSSSSGDMSSSSGEPSSSSSSSGSATSSSSSGDVTSSSSSGDVTSSSSSSSSGSTVPEDGGTDGEVPDSCTPITATEWVNSEVCGGVCPSTFESEFTPVFPNTFIDFVRVVFDPASTAVNTPYDFSLDPAVWQRDLSGLVGNSAADARYFKAESGVLQVSSFNAASSSVSATLTNVKLVEVTYDGDGRAQVVEGGTCLRLTSVLEVQN